MKSRSTQKVHLQSLPNVHTNFQLSSRISIGDGGRTALFQGQKEGNR